MIVNVLVFFTFVLFRFLKIGLVADCQLENTDIRFVNQDQIRTARRLEDLVDRIPFL